MILPDKHLADDRSLLGVGADILAGLDHASTVSETWDRFVERRKHNTLGQPVTFDWFVKGLTFLFAIKAITVRDGLLEVETER